MPTNSKSKSETVETLLTIADVAALDRCSPRTVRRAISAGLLEVIHIGPGGRLLRIRPSAHAAYRRACNE